MIRIRAAFDVGSGCSKVCVCAVDVTKGVVVKKLMSAYEEVLYGHDFKKRKDGLLGEEIQTRGMETLTRLVAQAKEFGAQPYMSGVATEVFRLAKNGPAFIEKIRRELGLDLHLIPQQKEAQLGFLTAVSAASTAGDNVHPRNIIAWDSGGASFQLTSSSSSEEEGGTVATTNPPSPVVSLLGSLGTSIVTAMMVDEVQENRSFSRGDSPNPATIEDARKLIEKIHERMPKEIPSWLTEKLVKVDASSSPPPPSDDHTMVIGIGEKTCLFNVAHLASGGQNPLNQQAVWEAIEKMVGKSDEFFESLGYPQPEMTIPKLCLMYAAMTYFSIPLVHYRNTIGSCEGVILSPEFWEKEAQGDEK